ncbi:uncharacterized protein LOC122083998 isoform X2 [Macadamia integrifolia]|uniref:uncharacterized protein LOC122083998 isoform X2 n=1 Tax=Macadamia integrifolia TaxID=60698 RepID=UPI001C4E954F|nr:uncharacterized protein LOC122083998 isoform X2 [Macadamia integrifolia]
MAHVTDITSADDIIVREDKTKGGDAVLVTESIEKDIKKVPPLPSNRSIYRVPKPLFKTKPEAYIPRMVSIGPFHRYKKHLKPMEAHKLRYLHDFRTRPESQATLEDYVKDMTKLEDRARQCYSEIVRLKSEGEFVKMMVTDGCFILELILRFAEQRDDPLLNAKWMLHVIKCDLILLENQLPFFVLQRLYELFTGTPNSNELDTLMFRFFQYVVPQSRSNRPERNLSGNLTKKIFDFCVIRRSSSKKDKEELVQPLIGKAEEEYAETPDLAVLEETEEKFGASSRIVEEGQGGPPALRPSMRMAEEGHGVTIEVREKPEEKFRASSRIAEEGHGVPTLRPSMRMAEEGHGVTIAVREKPEEKFGPSSRIAEEGHGFPAPRPSMRMAEFQAKHLLDFVRNSLLRSLTKTKRGKYVYSRCATELKEANVKFEKKEMASLLDITYEKGLLKIPTIKIQDGTESLLRNIIAFEQYGQDMCITDYAFFIDGLINSHTDVELLEKKGIIDRFLGEPKEVATLFNSLLKDVTTESGEYQFWDVYDGLERYYLMPFHRWKANLMLNYFSNPWASIGCIAALVLFAIAVFQAVCSILSLTT